MGAQVVGNGPKDLRKLFLDLVERNDRTMFQSKELPSDLVMIDRRALRERRQHARRKEDPARP
jgi:hypothetical protein